MEILLREQYSRMARQSSTEMITVVAISAGVIRSDRVSIPIWPGFIPNGFGIASVPFLLVKTITVKSNHSPGLRPERYNFEPFGDSESFSPSTSHAGTGRKSVKFAIGDGAFAPTCQTPYPQSHFSICTIRRFDTSPNLKSHAHHPSVTSSRGVSRSG